MSYINKLQNELGLRFLHQKMTTDRDTCIDWCLTNIDRSIVQYECNVYESYFSDHKPIILTILNQ